MSLYLAFDASIPPAAAYPGSQAVLGYIGGNTPHVWTVAEWQRFGHLKQFPIWVGYNEGDPVGHARDAAAKMESLGWARNLSPGSRRAVVLDFETEVDPAWVNAFASVINSSGYFTIVYGSESTIVQNPERMGRWIALYDNRADIPSGEDAIGHQYRANVPWENTAVDLSVLTDTMMAHGGIGPRHG